MQFNTYLFFNGDCRAAFNFYAQLFGGRITAMMTFGEAPACEQMPKAAHEAIMHACVEFGTQKLMGTDVTSEQPFDGIKGAHVVLDVADAAQAEWLFAALAEKGRIEMPIAKTFWAERYGIAIDRFGVPWMVNCAPAA